MSQTANRLREILLKPQNSLFVLTGVLVLLVSIAIYLLLGYQASKSLVEQMLHRQQVSARAGARSLESFFHLFGKSLSGFSTRGEITSPGADTDKILENFITNWEGTPVAGVIFVDTTGKVRFNGNRLGAPDIGVDVSDRDYYIWSKTSQEKEVFVSEPVVSRIGASKGKYIVVVATPVFDKKGSYEGVLAASIVLDELTEHYINPLKVSEKTRVYLVDDGGVILSSPIEKFIGVNYLEYISKSNIPGTGKIAEILRDALESNNEGKLDIALPNETKNGMLTRYLIASAPVNTGGEHWVLGVATPASDALDYLAPFYLKQVGVVALAFFAFLIVTTRIAKVVGYKEAVESEHIEHRIDKVDKNS